MVLGLLLEFADTDLALRDVRLQVQRLAAPLSPLALPLVRWLLAHLLDVACDLDFLRLAVVGLLLHWWVEARLGLVDALLNGGGQWGLLSGSGVAGELILINASGGCPRCPVDEVCAHGHDQLLLVHYHVFQFVDHGCQLLSNLLLKLGSVKAAALLKILAYLLEIVLVGGRLLDGLLMLKEGGRWGEVEGWIGGLEEGLGEERGLQVGV